jgi:N-acetylmuramoyl-L-alanine amidase
VVAFSPTHGLAREGVVGPVTADALAAADRPSATIGAGIEIDLVRQVLLIVRDGGVVWAFDTSTGSRPGTTPVGTFSVVREIDGLRVSPLGELWRPKYFHGGVAVHGYTSVPPYPASHGCVRVTYPAMDAIWAGGWAPVGTAVVVHG